MRRRETREVNPRRLLPPYWERADVGVPELSDLDVARQTLRENDHSLRRMLSFSAPWLIQRQAADLLPGDDRDLGEGIPYLAQVNAPTRPPYPQRTVNPSESMPGAGVQLFPGDYE